MRRVVLAPAARRDLEDIAEYVAREAGAGVAAELIKRIQSHVRMLAETPGAIGVARPELAEHLRSFPSRPFVLFFRYMEDRLQVVRILHERQDVDRHV